MDITETYTPLSEISDRINGLKQALVQENIDAALMMQSADLFYYAGTTQQAYLYVPVEGDPVLMVRKDVDRARAESPGCHPDRMRWSGGSSRILHRIRCLRPRLR